MDKDIAGTGKMKLLMFGTPNCVGCDAAKRYFANVNYEYIDCLEYYKRAQVYDVTAAPTFVIVDEDGEAIRQFVGFSDSIGRQILRSLFS